jgi:hypothetical protein
MLLPSGFHWGRRHACLAVLWWRNCQGVGSIARLVISSSLSAELHAQLKPVALNLAIMKRSVEQLADNQDQLVRKQGQMTQAIASLQAAEQDLSQQIFGISSACAKGRPRFSQIGTIVSAVNLLR